MTRDEAERLISDHQALLDRALKILADDGPPWGFVWNPEWARLVFEGDEAVVSWPKEETYYDSTSLEREEARFQAKLIFMSDDDLTDWKRKAKAEHDKIENKRREAERLLIETTERQQYEKLRAKYGAR